MNAKPFGPIHPSKIGLHKDLEQKDRSAQPVGFPFGAEAHIGPTSVKPVCWVGLIEFICRSLRNSNWLFVQEKIL